VAIAQQDVFGGPAQFHFLGRPAWVKSLPANHHKLGMRALLANRDTFLPVVS
jgi:hypothetical protein